MSPRPPTARTRVTDESKVIPLMSNGCPQVEAMDRQTAAIERQTAAYEVNSAKLDAVLDAITAGVEAFKPAADEIRDLGQAQKKFCRLLVKHRLKLAASMPLVMTFVGAVSPSAADLFGKLLKLWGLS